MSDTASTLATLRRLADEATPGPWATTGTKQCGAMSRVWPRYPSPDCICTMQVSNCSNWMRDRDYIAALHPGTVRKLLDVAEAALAYIDADLCQWPEERLTLRAKLAALEEEDDA